MSTNPPAPNDVSTAAAPDGTDGPSGRSRLQIVVGAPIGLLILVALAVAVVVRRRTR